MQGTKSRLGCADALSLVLMVPGALMVSGALTHGQRCPVLWEFLTQTGQWVPLLSAHNPSSEQHNTFVQGVFFNWYPPKKLKYVKSQLGESTLT